MPSIADILASARDQAARSSKIHGVVIGLVTNNVDPGKQGRVKLSFPWLSDSVESHWARVVQGMAGKERGQWFIPEVGDEVLVGFDQGDVRFPYVLRSLYNGVDQPPGCDDTTSSFGGTGYDHGAYSCGGGDHNGDGANNLRFIRSRAGSLLIFDDTDGAERIALCDPGGAQRVEVMATPKKVVISSADGDIELIANKQILFNCETLVSESRDSTSQDAGTTFTLAATSDMTHDSGANMSRDASANVEEMAGQGATYTAGSAFDVQSGTGTIVGAGTSLAMTATTAAELSAASFSIGSQTTAELSAAMLTLSGQAKATLGAQAMVSIMGAMVRLNC